MPNTKKKKEKKNELKNNYKNFMNAFKFIIFDRMLYFQTVIFTKFVSPLPHPDFWNLGYP